MALYTKEQLNYERSIGLQMTDAENDESIEINGDENLPNRYAGFLNKISSEQWSNERHEKWLKNTLWPKWTQDEHRKKFKGIVYIDPFGTISYEK